MKRKNIYGFMLVVLSCTTSFAQEVDFSIGGYFTNSLKTDSTYDTNASLGYQIGVGYRYYLNPQWSLGAEINYKYSKLDFIQRNVKENWSVIDIENHDYEFIYNSKYRKESVSFNTFQIPLTIQYETKGTVKWYIRSGVSIGIITGDSKSKITMNDLHTSGYYKGWDAELHGPHYMGFGAFGNQTQKRNLDLSTRYSWLLETGVKQELGNKQNLYIGVFLDLGLTNLVKDNKRIDTPISHVNNYDNPLEYHSIWTQEKYKDTNLKDYYIGIKLRYSFSL